MVKIGAAVVTYNRLNYLKICLHKIQSQTFNNIDILVVNNNSKDGTKEFLLSNDLYQIHLDENSGPAGGFYEAIKFFIEKGGYDYLWLMDDDFFPAKDCLEYLLYSTNSSSVAYPSVRLKSMVTHNYPSWSGVLLSKHIVENVGYPLKELFFWAEDTEYLQVRIEQKHKFGALWVSKAKGVHFTERKSNYRSNWRYYYEVRNMLYVRLYLQKRTSLRYRKIIRSWSKLFFSIVLRENNKRIKMQYFFLGSIHGIAKKLGKTIDPNEGKY